MPLKLQISIAVILFIMIFIIANMVRKKKIDLRYALSWIVLVCLIFVLDLFPQIVFFLAALVGIKTPSNMVFFVGFILTVIMIYSLAVSVSHLSMKTKRLTQEMALLRKEMEEKIK